MARLVTTGRYEGRAIRRARKPYVCEQWVSGWPQINRCGRPINAGDLYVEGDVDPDRAGGFGHERICLECAGPRPPTDSVKRADAEALKGRA